MRHSRSAALLCPASSLGLAWGFFGLPLLQQLRSFSPGRLWTRLFRWSPKPCALSDHGHLVLLLSTPSKVSCYYYLLHVFNCSSVAQFH